MDLNVYDVIVRPVITDKAYKINQQQKKLVLQVHQHANKPMVKTAMKQLFNAVVEDVKILNRKGKVRKVGRRVVQGQSKKIAIVTLAEGYSLDLFNQANAPVAAERSENKE
ncbi:MAG TPA: 50S ribosomal protein L23 [Candidatus Limnocylindria bacterium]|nr:50S ribosomal protein L23 [Candidatus Limnocylindria bacterium]